MAIRRRRHISLKLLTDGKQSVLSKRGSAMSDARTNKLTFPSFDPQSRQPSYKYAAVQVTHPEPWDHTP